jgi:hypothetical protein
MYNPTIVSINEEGSLIEESSNEKIVPEDKGLKNRDS